MLVSEFDYALPPGLIAQHPAPRRRASRLLHLDAAGGLRDLQFADLPGLVGPGDALVLNDTRVIKARLAGRKASGGAVEIFVERLLGPREALALIRASHPPRPGSDLFVEDIALKIVARHGDLYQVSFSQDVETVLERHGAVPLPPYITHAPQAEDAERYQTVYAAHPGAVAAPTAGLHFDDSMLSGIAAKGTLIEKITLHVGAGTFQPVRVDEVEKHRMHKERYAIPPDAFERLSRKKVLAVGTTSLRALETAAATGKLEGETDLFVYPGFEFKVVKRLLTNFHLPRSTLLMLACAFGGKERVLSAYHHAVQSKYRFFSYGDAMLIER
ncbi:MAG TPA: tRNA preQ1(34) S-adenosylmethionine ribosyltransferase-isomerase QueA [Burkholderiales bacterium]|nr:tRNA preQ1(34) S-adenosylmethionine ribosyltransferase-isomerase QueA [Burkholderiales bacterium]